MSDYLGFTQSGNGDNYTIETGADFLLWLAYGYRNGTTTASTQTFGGVALTEQHDNSTDLAGGGDPTANLSYKVTPAATAQALSVAWSATPSAEDGFAISFENVDQLNPIYATNGSGSATYGSTNTPSLTYDAPDDSTVVYYKFHCTNSTSTIGTPAGFTLIANHVILVSPAYRQVSIFYKKVTTAETGQAVGADTSGSAAIGGVHGFVVLQAPEVLPGVQIGTVDSDDIVEIGQTSVDINGTGFEASQGTGSLLISPTDDDTDTLARAVTATSWSDTLIEFDIPSSFQMLYGSVYLFVTNNSAEVNAAGKELTLVPPAANDYITIKEQSGMGVLKDVTGLELDADQIEFQKLSNGGGDVYISVSGTVWIDGYPGAVPSSDEIYVRLGDKSDQTWSSATLETISIGSTLSEVLSDLSLSSSVLNSIESSKVISYSILNDVIVDLATSYSVLESASSDLLISSDVLNSLVADKAISYSLLNTVLSDKQISNAILNAVDSDRLISFSLLESVVADYSPSWNVASSLAEVLSDLAITYNALNAVDIDQAVSWDALNEITTDKEISFDLLNQVLASLQLSSDVLNSAVISQTISWDVLSALTGVLSDLSVQWDVRQSIVSSLIVQSDILDAVDSDSEILFSIVNAVVSDLSQSWDVDSLISVTADLVSSWSILEAAESSLTVNYKIGDVTITTPDSRTLYIPNETRTIVIDLENRSVTVN